MKLLLTLTPYSEDFRPLTDQHLLKIREAVPGLDVVRADSPYSPDKIAQELASADIIAGYPAELARIDLSQAPKLRWMHSFSSGVDKVLTPQIKASSIKISNSAGIHATPIAEHVLGFLLVWTRRFQEAFRAQQIHDWAKLEATELSGKTIIVAGLGAIGSDVARLASAFNAKVIGSVRTKRDQLPNGLTEVITDEELDDALPRADFVCVCLPYAPSTHHRFGAKQFKAMKESAVITNIGRGGIINEAELITALNNGDIGGAMLDVTETEPLPRESPLWDMPKVFITSHYAGLSEKYMDRAVDRLVLNLQAFAKDEPLPNLVDKELGY